ncbi:S8 family peptidase [Flammeovirga pectinis]|uniref:S8 family peptidase n=1 Tax=Flammeovirga pectinis TaxID=2494373 RepID=A0A3S9NXY0_9BACT|nr:S8 family serine peptidase [Flammeovirga pectinis]AZQ60809.1 S8 family peptidase [Flammeovirga pectinis]
MEHAKFKLAIALFLGFLFISCTPNENLNIDQPVKEQDLTTEVKDTYIVLLENQLSNARTKTAPVDFAQRQIDMRIQAESFVQEFKIPTTMIDRVYGGVVNGFTVKISDQKTLEALKADDRVFSIEKDEVFLLDNTESTIINSVSTQTTPWGITRVGGALTYAGTNVAYIIDSGIDLNHPDLNVDETKGYNIFKFGIDSRTLDDTNGHGTHVAGTVAAIDNNIGVVGVAAGASVIPVKVVTYYGGGTASGIIEGVNFVGTNGQSGDVANMSLGIPTNASLDRAVKVAAAKGIKFVLAAGNESQNTSNVSPARADGTNVYTISAIDSTDAFAYFSNFGASVDWAAPGVSILSTTINGNYGLNSGTSMAAPHAAGVLLLGAPRASGNVKNDPDDSTDVIISR